MKAVGIGIVGAGHISGAHAAAVQKAHGADLIAVCDPDLDRARSLADRHGNLMVFPSLDEMLACSQVEAVIIATPNHLHPSQAIECARAGRHVLCEKPIANSVAEAQAAIEAASSRNLVFRSGFNQRFLQQVKLAKLAIERGVIGDIYGFRSVFSGKWDNYFDGSNFRFDPALSGGTTINDNLIHRYDMVRHLLRDEFRSVVADLAHSVIPPVVDDNVNLIVKTGRGARGTFSADRYSPVIADSTELYGTKGSIHVVTNAVSPFHAVPLAIFTTLPENEMPMEIQDALFPQARARKIPGWTGWMTIWPQFNDAYADQVAEFVSAIRGREKARIGATGIDGVRATELIQAAYTSHIEGRWVDLPLPENAIYQVPSYSSTPGA